MALYRVFTLDWGKVKLPEGAQLEESYPAFAVVSATDLALAELRKHYPVEKLDRPEQPARAGRQPPCRRPEVVAAKPVAAT